MTTALSSFIFLTPYSNGVYYLPAEVKTLDSLNTSDELSIKPNSTISIILISLVEPPVTGETTML